MSEHIHQTINKLDHCVHCGKPMNDKTPKSKHPATVMSARRIRDELRRLNALRDDQTQRELYGAQQALGWSLGEDYMAPSKAFK